MKRKNNVVSEREKFFKEIQKILIYGNDETEKYPIRKIAFFTDSHGLYEPTLAILEDIKKRGINEIYSLGDNIGLGPNPREVIDLLDEYNVVSLAGNYEDILNLNVYPFLSYLSREKQENMAWTKAKLTKEQIEKIKVYPHFIDLNINGKNIALCHFANDVRCDFLNHDVWGYVENLRINMSGFHQFLYTNSMQQMLEVAFCLGMDYNVLSNCNNSTETLKLIRKFILEKKEKLELNKSLGGYLSYVKNPLFIRNEQLLTINDYQYIIEGHTHFDLFEKNSTSQIYSLRAAGIGYSPLDKDLAQYMLLTIEKDKFNFEKIIVPFDREKMEHSIINCELPNPTIMKYTLTKK